MNLLRAIAILLALGTGLAHAQTPAATPSAGSTVIYTAREVVTMRHEGDFARGVAVRDGRVIAVGSPVALARAFPGAARDDTFADKVIVPGLIDPHIHVVLGGLMYAQPFAPPWPMASADGMSKGYPSREAFLARLSEIVATAAPDGSPVVVYGYHNLVQGEIDRRTLDVIAPDRALVVWHYSGHDFYLNSAALRLIGATPELLKQFHGVELDSDGALTGRLYEDAGFYLFGRLGAALFNPDAVARGTGRYFEIMRRAGVTTTAELAYGAFGRGMEDRVIAQNWSARKNAFRLYLVPEARAFEREFGGPDAAASAIKAMTEGRTMTPAPVLPRVKFFSDGAYYSQTMRLTPPGYLAGQSRGSLGEWVIPSGEVASKIRPYMRAGLSAHIHSNGDAAQDSTLEGLAQLRADGLKEDFVIEHAGLFSPAQTRRAAQLNAMVSAASHYVYYLSASYAQPLGPVRARWISPVGDFARSGIPVALHSDAPLAPPQPLRAASVQVTRATREGGVYEPKQALSRYQAMQAITLSAARVLGLSSEMGSIEPGKRADFTILDRDPLRTDARKWPSIGVWGVVLDGEKRPVDP